MKGKAGRIAVLALGLVAIVARHACEWRQDRRAGLRLLAVRETPPPPLRRTPRVSILVAAWNEAAYILPHLQSVQALTYPDLEYILCAGGADGTYDLAKRHMGEGMVLLQQQPGEGKQGALRRCLRGATGEIVFLTDADTVLDAQTFSRTLAPVLNEDEAVAGGVARPMAPDRAAFPLVTFLYGRESYLAAGTWAHRPTLLGRNAAVRRDALEAAGRFDADAWTGTDYRLGRDLKRHGFRVRFIPESAVATVYHSDPLRYARYRSRCMRTAFRHGVPTGDWRGVWDALSAVLAGLVVLTAPIVLLRGRFFLSAAWAWMLAFALCRDVRQAALGALLTGRKPGVRFFAWVPAWLLLDSLIWASTPLQLLPRRLRDLW